jgi:hypothetical protein
MTVSASCQSSTTLNLAGLGDSEATVIGLSSAPLDEIEDSRDLLAMAV